MDIADRLRRMEQEELAEAGGIPSGTHYSQAEVCREAADEIKSLRAELVRSQAIAIGLTSECAASMDTIAAERRRADAAEAELDKARKMLKAILYCTYRPNPFNQGRIDVVPGRHRAFGAAIERALDLVNPTTPHETTKD